MQGKNEDMTNEQSAKKQRMSVAVRKELLSLRHRFGETTSCEGRLTTQFRLVNSGKILSRDERRQMPTPYCYRAWTAFPHFLIRFTRAIQRNEKGWDALFLYVLAGTKKKIKEGGCAMIISASQFPDLLTGFNNAESRKL